MGKILLVDDSLTDRTLIRKILQARDHEIVEAEEGDSVVDAAVAQHPDLILLDIVMPGVNGYEICRNLKKTEDTKNIPVVFISSKKHNSDIFWGKLQGAEEYLVKPFQPEILLMLVDKYLGKKQDNQGNE